MKIVTLLFILLAFPIVFYGQDTWELKRDRDNIKVYTRKKAGSKFKEFKAVTQLQTSVSALVAIMKDQEAYKELFPMTMEVQILEQKGETYQIQYVKTDVPFPATDRDGVYEFKYQYTPASGEVLIKVVVLKEGMPEQKKMVRIKEGSGFWKFKPIANDKVEVVYQFHAEPGGSIPAWLANSQVVESPWDAMTALVTLARIKKYASYSFQFMQ